MQNICGFAFEPLDVFLGAKTRNHTKARGHVFVELCCIKAAWNEFFIPEQRTVIEN